MSDQHLLTLTEAARLLGLSPATLRGMTERGDGPIPAKIDYVTGRPRKDGSRFQYGYSLAEIERWATTKADPDTALSFWLGRLWLTLRALSPAETRATLSAISGTLAGLRDYPALAEVWAAVGMALLADARARGVELPDPERSGEARVGRLPHVA